MKILILILCFILPSFAHAMPPIQTVVSKQGITAWLIEDHNLPLISMQFSFHGGVEMDPANKQGLAILTSSLLTQGAGPYNANVFQNKLAASSIALTFGAGRDVISGSLKMLRREKDKGFRFLSLALQKPRFEQTDFERLRDQQAIGLRFQVTSPAWQARYALYSHVYGAHPYGYRSQGTALTLGNITRDDVQEFAQRSLVKDKLLISVVGAISKVELAYALDEVFGLLPRTSARKKIEDVSWPLPKIICVPRSGKQTNLFFVAPMVKRDHPDWYAAMLANYILGGGGFESRLMKALRAQNGLTYGISTGLGSMEYDALIAGSMATGNETVAQAQTYLHQNWQIFYDDGITAQELRQAKDYFIGTWPLHFVSTDGAAGILLLLQQEGLGKDYADQRKTLLEGVSLAEVNQVIKKYFDPSKLSVAAVGAVNNLSCDHTKELSGE